MYKRIIGLVLIDSGIFCRTRNFTVDYHYTNRFIDTKHFDELVFIDVSSNHLGTNLPQLSESIESIVESSQLPISIGGGIKKIEDIAVFREFGADRYVLNQTYKVSDNLIYKSILKYGQSTILSSINHWGPYIASKDGVSEIRLVDRIKEIADNRGGDVLLNSVERDGTLRGLDLETIDELSNSCNLSFILSGGLGNLSHLSEALKRDNVVGVCTSNVYHLTTSTILNWRIDMISRGLNVRRT
jgi:cyclase